MTFRAKALVLIPTVTRSRSSLRAKWSRFPRPRNGKSRIACSTRSDELIRRGNHQSVQALEADIRSWANGWNQDPKPLIWTKPAEQILESIGRLLTRISGAGH